MVWCPKYRRKVLIDQITARLKTILREVAAEHQATVLALEVMPDHGSALPNHHVHLLCEVDPPRLPTLWTNSYFVSSGGGAPRAVIKQYIEHQKNV